MNQSFTLKRFTALCFFTLLSLVGRSQLSIPSIDATVSENFNGMGSSAAAAIPSGFRINGSNSAANWATGAVATSLAAGTTGSGVLTSSSGGGLYNFANGVNATSTDRALGILNSGSYTSPSSIILKITNNTGSRIGSLSLSFDYEKYRSGSRAWNWTFFHGATASPSTPATDGDQAFVADAGNTTVSNPPLSITKNVILSGLNIPAGSDYYLRWSLTGVGGSTNGQALAIDNFSLSAGIAISADATLSNLTLSSGALTPAFQSGTTSYTATVSHNTSAVSLTPVTTDAGATVKVNGASVTSGSATTIALVTGANTINTVISAENGTTTKTYTVVITKEATPVPQLTLTSGLPGFTALCVGALATRSFQLSGNDLDGTPINISPLPGYSYSEAPNGPFTITLSFNYSGSSFANKTIYVQFAPTAVQSYNGTLPISGGGANDLEVPAQGIGVNTAAAVTTKAATAVMGGSAQVGGTVNENGCSPLTSYGAVYSKVPGFTSGTAIASGTLSGSDFSVTLTGLGFNSKYYYRAFVVTGDTSYGAEQTFTTTAVPVPMADQDDLTYVEDFSAISTWTNGFGSGAGAQHFSTVAINGSGATPNPTRITTSGENFSSGTSGGIQKGSGAIVLLSTGATDNTTSVAFDLFMDFTGLQAGSLSFDWASVNNSTGDRRGSLRVYGSTDGSTFSEIASVLNFTNNSPTSGTVNVSLPPSFNNSAAARLRFYYHNGTGGTSGSRPKISIANLQVSAIATTPCITPSIQPTALSFEAVGETSITGHFEPASPAANKYLVVMSRNSSLGSEPVDGQVYAVGSDLGDGDVLSYSSATHFTASNLSGGTPYYFFIYAVNTACVGGPKYLLTQPLKGQVTTVAGIPACVTPETQPTILSLTSGVTTINGSFTATTADEYLVVRSTTPTLTSNPVNGISYNMGNTFGNATVVQRSNSTNFIASGLNPATQYYFFVFALNAQTCTGGPLYNVEAPLFAGTETQPLAPCVTPAAPATNLSLLATHNAASSSFNASPTADHYVVIRSTSATLSAGPVNGSDYAVGTSLGGGTVVASGASTSFQAAGLTASTQYYFFVYAASKTCSGGTKYLNSSLTGSVTTQATPQYNVFFGNLHSHSDYSDGNKDIPGFTPGDNYSYAKTAECLDFLGISEHNHFSSVGNPGNLLTNYRKGSAQADSFNLRNPSFLALYGMEWGVISGGGHVLVYGDGMDKLYGWESNVGGQPGNNYDVFVAKNDYTGTKGLFKTINDFRAQNTFATLAHPNSSDFNNLAGSAYNVVADSAIVGTAVESGPAFSTSTTYNDPASSLSLTYYRKLLSLGYHVGPTIDHDNHNTNFGKSTRSRTAVVAPSLSRSELVKAMRGRHFYATQDCDTRVDFTINTRIMGSVFSDRNAPTIAVRLSDPTTPTSTAKIRLMYGVPGSGVLPVVIDSATGSAFDYVHNGLAVNATGYYYLEIDNGTRARVITSPIWYTRTCGFATDTIASACNSFQWYGNTYTTSTTATKHFTTAASCDSLVTLRLTITGPVFRDTTATACESFTWYGTTYTASGSYSHVIAHPQGCDTTVTLALTINPRPATSITASGPTTFCPGSSVTLTSDAAASYLWSNGASSPSITVSGTGFYSVTITDANGCSATSGAVSVAEGDNEAPVVRTKNITIMLDSSGRASLTADVLNDGSTDNCSLATDAFSADKTNFTCADLGANTVTFSVRDASGNTASGTAIVTVVDQMAPAFTAPANSTVALESNCAITVPDLTIGVLVKDNCSIANLTQLPVAGSVLSSGHGATHTVTLTATDGSGNTTSHNVVLTAKDESAPGITAPSALRIAADAGACSASGVALGSPLVSDNCLDLKISNNAPLTFAIGTTEVTWTVIDANGNTTSATQSVTVVDSEAPRLVGIPANATVDCDAVPAPANVTATDNCAFNGVVSYGETKADGNCSSNYALTRTWSTTDAAGNITTASQTITVQDTKAPLLALPGNITKSNDAGICGAAASFTATATDNCDAPVVTYSHQPGSVFPVGTTTVTAAATDACGNATSGSFTITVTDNENPTITAPAAITVGRCNTITLGNAVAGDNCSGVTVTNNAPPTYPVGTTVVTWTAKDAAGNISTATQSVTVAPLPTAAIAVTRLNTTFTGLDNNTIALGYGAQTLTLTASGGATYSWNTGAITAAIHVSPMATTTYTVTVTDQYGCSSKKSVTITVIDARCGNKMDKVLVCHKTGSAKNPWNQICISPNAVATHLGNGGYLGTCNVAPVTVREGASKPAKEEATATVLSYPNPSSGQVNVRLSGFAAGKVVIEVLDGNGKAVTAQQTSVSNMVEDLTLDLSKLSSGVYNLKVSGGKDVRYSKVVIVK